MAFFCEPGSGPGCDLGVLIALGAILVLAATAIFGRTVIGWIIYRRAIRRRLNALVAGQPSSPREPAAGARITGRRASTERNER